MSGPQIWDKWNSEELISFLEKGTKEKNKDGVVTAFKGTMQGRDVEMSPSQLVHKISLLADNAHANYEGSVLRKLEERAFCFIDDRIQISGYADISLRTQTARLFKDLTKIELIEDQKKLMSHGLGFVGMAGAYMVNFRY